MAEVLTLTAPVTPSVPTTTTYSVRRLLLDHDRSGNERILILLRDNNNAAIQCEYDGSAALTLIIALNKANLSIKSLERRVIEQLVADGKLPAGSVTGSPD